MGIFNKNYEVITKSAVATIIAKDSRINGHLSLECDIHVDGFIEGSIHTSKSFIIGKEGRVKGNVRAHHVLVSGLLEGECEGEIVEVLAGGKVCGNIHTNELSIEKGGQFIGEAQAAHADAVVTAITEQSDEAIDLLTEESS